MRLVKLSAEVLLEIELEDNADLDQVIHDDLMIASNTSVADVTDYSVKSFIVSSNVKNCHLSVIREWEQDGFKLRLQETGRRDKSGKVRLAYRFEDTRYEDAEHDNIVFEGDDYFLSPMHQPGSDAAVAAILSFMALGEGDTDSDFFDSYTPAQLEWRNSNRREELSMIVTEMEEPKP